MNRLPVLILVLSLLFPVAAKGAAAPLHKQPDVRIAILRDAESVTLDFDGGFEIRDALTNRLLEKGRNKRNVQIVPNRQGLLVGEKVFPSSHVQVKCSKTFRLRKGKEIRRYRGDVHVWKNPKGVMTVINVLDLESYVRGVLFHEISHRWPMEAMKAQAVATRTYALYQVENNKTGMFDVTNDVYSQVYGGKSAERYRTNIAVNRTRAEVLAYDGKVLPAYFHSNSGGHTENVKELWNHDLPPLRGVRDDYSIGMPAYNWKKNFRSKDVQEKLSEAGYVTGVIKEIIVTERTESGRVKNLRIISRDGKQTDVPGKKFREVLGPNDLRSTKYDVLMQGYYFDLVGYGWGHGVGMSQWGAYSMARNRHNYKDILFFYYPGTKIVSFTDLSL